MVRVIANLSIHPDVGPEIAKNMEIVELLVQMLGMCCTNVLSVIMTIRRVSNSVLLYHNLSGFKTVGQFSKACLHIALTSKVMSQYAILYILPAFRNQRSSKQRRISS